MKSIQIQIHKRIQSVILGSSILISATACQNQLQPGSIMMAGTPDQFVSQMLEEAEDFSTQAENKTTLYKRTGKIKKANQNASESLKVSAKRAYLYQIQIQSSKQTLIQAEVTTRLKNKLVSSYTANSSQTLNLIADGSFDQIWIKNARSTATGSYAILVSAQVQNSAMPTVTPQATSTPRPQPTASPVATPVPPKVTPSAPMSNSLPQGNLLLTRQDPDTGFSQVSILNIDGSGLQQVSQSDEAGSPEFSADGSWLAYGCVQHKPGMATRNICVVNSDGTEGKQISFDDLSYGPHVSNTGFISYASDSDGDRELYRTHPTGYGLTRLTNNTNSDTGPYPSPDGRWIGFWSDRARPGNNDIYIMDPNGQSVKRLTQDGENRNLKWHPNGQQLVFERVVYGQNKLFRVHLDGSNLKQMTNGSGNEGDQAFNKEGSLMAFRSDRSGKPEIWLLNTQTGIERQLTFLNSQAYTPYFSPDGQWIAFRAYVSSRASSEIFVVHIDGTGLKNVSNNFIEEALYGWK